MRVPAFHVWRHHPCRLFSVWVHHRHRRLFSVWVHHRLRLFTCGCHTGNSYSKLLRNGVREHWAWRHRQGGQLFVSSETFCLNSAGSDPRHNAKSLRQEFLKQVNVTQTEVSGLCMVQSTPGLRTCFSLLAASSGLQRTKQGDR